MPKTSTMTARAKVSAILCPQVVAKLWFSILFPQAGVTVWKILLFSLAEDWTLAQPLHCLPYCRLGFNWAVLWLQDGRSYPPYVVFNDSKLKLTFAWSLHEAIHSAFSSNCSNCSSMLLWQQLVPGDLTGDQLTGP